MKQAPKHLRKETRQWFNAVQRGWELEEHHIKILTAAAECWDRLQMARETIARDGMTTPTRDGGLKGHPCLAVERDCRIAFARLLRELQLDVEPPEESRIPRLYATGGRNFA
jgi:P27 family predicted phage terminase small subunit